MLEPRAVRGDRALGRLIDGGFEKRKVSGCNKACAQELTFRDQSLWLKGEVCRNGPVATFSTLDLPPVGSNPPTVYGTSGVSILGQFERLNQVICYDTYFLYEGETICRESCFSCGPEGFDCVFISPGLAVSTQMPEGGISSAVPYKDCDLSDPNDCGFETPGVPPNPPLPAD